MTKKEEFKLERNQDCPCGSGRKVKNCCLPVYETARRNIRLNKERKEDLLRKYMIKRGIKEARLKMTQSGHIITYLINDAPALIINYRGIPLSMETWYDCVAISKVDVRKIPMKIIRRSFLEWLKAWFKPVEAKGKNKPENTK